MFFSENECKIPKDTKNEKLIKNKAELEVDRGIL